MMAILSKAVAEALEKSYAALFTYGVTTIMPPEDDFIRARLDIFAQATSAYSIDSATNVSSGLFQQQPTFTWGPRGGAVGSTYSGSSNFVACTCELCTSHRRNMTTPPINQRRVSNWGGDLVATIQDNYERQEYLKMLTGSGVAMQANLWQPEDEPKPPPEPPQPSWNNKRKLDLD